MSTASLQWSVDANGFYVAGEYGNSVLVIKAPESWLLYCNGRHLSDHRMLKETKQAAEANYKASLLFGPRPVRVI